jgi:HSP20 family molecular chaperone IbpA
MVVHAVQAWPFDEIWPGDRVRLRLEPRWRPAADTYETPTTVEIVVDLAGIGEDDFEIQLFEDVLVVDGARRLPPSQKDAIYHTAGIPQGPFRLEMPLPAAVDPEPVDARYELGLLRVTLRKRAQVG